MKEEILSVTEQVSIALELGESHFREFKSALHGQLGSKSQRDLKDICVDIAETLVAFANADGGELLVGVEDDSTVTGLTCEGAKLEALASAPFTHVHKDTPLPAPRILKTSYDSKLILYFSVAKGSAYVYLTSDGRCLQRKDRESVPISSESIAFSRQEITSREYDRVFADNADIGDLDHSLIGEVATHVSKGMSAEKCLQHLGLAEYDGVRFRLRKAALLLFAREPSKWHPRLQVRVLKINGTELRSGQAFNVTADQEVTDNIISLMESSWELVRPHLTETRFSKDAMFQSQIMYPELACREALVNAIAHRDYSMEGRGIEVRIYTDRLEILSPGGLLSSVNIDDLRKCKGTHQSRNSLTARVLREAGYMRELGEGMRRIFELMKYNDLTPPELASSNDSFSVTLNHKTVYTTEEKLWLDQFGKYDLDRDQKIVVRLGYNGHEISPREIWDEVGIVDTDYYRRLLESLRKLGLLKSTTNKQTAIKISRARRIHVKQVPRFSIVPPAQVSVPAPDQVESTDDSDYASVYVGNVPYEASPTDLENVFGAIGPVADVYIPVNHETGLPRGFAFVEYESSGDAKKALGLSAKLSLFGRILYVKESVAKNKNGS